MSSAAYDVVIALVVAAVPLYLVELRYRWPSLRNREIRAVTAPFLVLVWLVVVYAGFVEPRLLVVTRANVRIGNGNDTVRVALVSDTDLGDGRFQTDAARITAKVMSLKPDLVILAGDLASTEKGTEMFAPFKGLKAPLGVYAVLGASDYRAGAVTVRNRIESYGVRLLVNKNRRIDVDGRSLWIAGVDDLRYGRPDFDKALTGIAPGQPVILAAHDPDAVEQAEVHGVGLVVAGATGGGRIRLPGIGPVMPMPTALGRRFDQGLFTVGPTSLFITSGAGGPGPRPRLFDPPEVALLNVTF